MRLWTLAVCAALTGFCPWFMDVAEAQSASAPPSRAEALLRAMTVDEKLGQLVQRAGGRGRALNSRLDEEEYARVRAGQVGSYLHVAGAEPLGELQTVAVKESRLGIPLLFAMDVVHGYRTLFPVPLALASSWNPGLLRQTSRVAAIEATSAGLHWTFAPMIDIARDPRWGRIVEGAGEDPYLGARMAVAQVQGFQDGDLSRPDTLLATAKHFGAYGAAIGGRDYNSADISERTLHEVYLPPFHAAASAGVGTFMSAFNDIGGVPTTGNRALLRDVLRDKWGWRGFVVSDWNAVAELISHGVVGNRREAGIRALDAGVDMDMIADVYAQDLKDAVVSNPSLMQQLDEAVLRVLRAKEALGLFDRPMQYHDAAREARVLLSPGHRALAREAARQSMVLLRNEGAVLPLKLDQIRTLAVVGALANDNVSMLGSWRANGRADDVVNLLQGIRNAVPANVKVVYEPGADPRSDDLSGIDAAVRAANQADATVVVIGEPYDWSGEARSRADVSMPASQLALAQRVLATGKPVVIVLSNGRPMAIPWLAEHAPAILEAWMPGVEAGNALADILFGKASPGGKLTVTFPRTTGQVPFDYAARATGRPADPDLSRDSSRYFDQPITPLYPFGHGLSYTEFRYSDLRQSTQKIGRGERIEISAVIENAGKMTGDEVVQLYVRDPVASVARPVLELRGFKRITLRPGERKRVTFTLSPEQLAIYEAPGQWKVEPGRIEFMIGASSADLRLRGAFEIAEPHESAVPAASLETPVSVAAVQ
ncbi:MAG TPA: glycoside hydrolase family 3 N-terminal domain-containing protein [Steroidobacteraceae bacterium]